MDPNSEGPRLESKSLAFYGTTKFWEFRVLSKDPRQMFHNLGSYPWSSVLIVLGLEYPPAPTPIESGGTYVYSTSPEPPYLGYWLPLIGS